MVDLNVLNRNIILQEIKDINSSSKNKCISTKNNLNKYIKISNRIGTESVTASAYKACFPLNCKYSIAVKKVPLNETDIKYEKDPESIKALNNSFVWRELYYLKLCNLLVKNNICPHLPLVYDYYLCNHCVFDNKNLLKNYPNSKNCALIINELADGDLKTLLTKEKLPVDDIQIIYFQIYIALYCINKYFKMQHQDLHWGNVLYHKIPKGGYIKYIIQGEEILIPNRGYLIVLWDFERTKIKGKIDSKDLKNSNSDNVWEDYRRITSMLQKDSEQRSIEYDDLGEKLKKILKLYKTSDEFILNYSKYLDKKFKNSSEKYTVLDTFDTDKNIKLSSSDNIKRFYVNQK